MNNEKEENANQQPEPDEFKYSTDGKNHKFEAKGDAAKGLAAAASAIVGFIIGVYLMG